MSYKNVVCDYGCGTCVTIPYLQARPYGWSQIPYVLGFKDCCDKHSCRVRAGLEVPVVLATPVVYAPVPVVYTTPSYYDPTTVIVVQNTPQKKVVHKVHPRNGGFTNEKL